MDDDDDDLVAEEVADDVSEGGAPDGSTKIPDAGSNETSVGAAGLRDMPADQDELGFGIYVESVAEFLIHKDTKPPLTMSIEGAWGSGKSSFMCQLANEIENKTKEAPDSPRIIKFNAWRLDKDESVWAAFALSVTQDLRQKLNCFGRLRADVKLRWRRTDWSRGWFSFVRFTLACLFLGYTGIAMVRYLSSHSTALNPFTEAVREPSQPATTPKPESPGQPVSQSPGLTKSQSVKPEATKLEIGKPELPKPESPKPEDVLIKILFAGLGGVGYILLVAWLLKKATEIVGNPLEIDLHKYSSDPRYDDRRAFIQTFHEDFVKIVEAYSEGRKIFIFIDDLDRCEIPRAANLMQSINLLLSDSSQIVHILGIDREKIAAGLAAKYHDLLPYLDERRDISVGRLGREFGFSFLEKFIQIPFQVPRPTKREVDLFLDALNQNRRKPAGKPGVLPAAGTMFYAKADSPMVTRIVTDIAPALEYNPRRIKQFINQFRLSAIIASQTGLFDPEPESDFAGFTPEILAKLLVITLRWPSLISDALSSRKLLFALEVMAISDAPDRSLKLGDFGVKTALAELWSEIDALKTLLRVGIEMRTPPSRNIVIPRQSLENVDLVRYLQVSPAVRSRLSREREEKPSRSPPIATKSVGIGDEFKPDPDYYRGLAGLIKQ